MPRPVRADFVRHVAPGLRPLLSRRSFLGDDLGLNGRVDSWWEQCARSAFSLGGRMPGCKNARVGALIDQGTNRTSPWAMVVTGALCLCALARGAVLVHHHLSIGIDGDGLEIFAVGGSDRIVADFMGPYSAPWEAIAPYLDEPSILALFLPPADPADPDTINNYLARFRGPLTALAFPTIVCAENEYVDLVERFPGRPLFGLELHMDGLDAPLPKWAGMVELVTRFEKGRLWKLPE